MAAVWGCASSSSTFLHRLIPLLSSQFVLVAAVAVNMRSGVAFLDLGDPESEAGRRIGLGQVHHRLGPSSAWYPARTESRGPIGRRDGGRDQPAWLWKSPASLRQFNAHTGGEGDGTFIGEEDRYPRVCRSCRPKTAINVSGRNAAHIRGINVTPNRKMK